MSPRTVEPLDVEVPSRPTTAEVPYASAPTAAGISRRQYRFLLGLTLANTLMLAAFVAGPAISRMSTAASQKLEQWKINREEAAARRKFNADYTAALTRSLPPDTVAYDDHPARAAALLARGGDYRPIRPGTIIYFPPQPWQLPAGLFPSSPAFQLGTRSDLPTVFAAGRRTPSGIEGLVWVSLESEQVMQAATFSDQRAQTSAVRRYEVRQRRVLTAHTYVPIMGQVDQHRSRSLQILQPDDRRTTITWTKGTSWENGRIDADLKGILRVFAGQADPNDASHFTVPYDLDGQPGVIDGWLRDDQVVLLQPRSGRIVDQDVPYARNRVWNPYAEPPASRPADPLPPLIPADVR